MNAAAVYLAECENSTLRGGGFWKIKMQPRMLTLFWRALNNLLPTNSWLHQHHLREDAMCSWGCGRNETINHLLKDCIFITKIRRECERMHIAWEMRNNEILESIWANGNISKGSAFTCFLTYIVYNIWKARNEMNHGEPFLQPTSIVIAAVHDASQGNWTVHCSHQQLWTPLPMHWLKMNFGGLVLPNNRAGTGCIIRDHTGEMILAKGTQGFSRSVAMTVF